MALLLSYSVLLLSFQSALAEIVPSQSLHPEARKDAFLETVPPGFNRNHAEQKAQRLLQDKRIQSLLEQKGYSPEEARARVSSLTDQQVQTLASASDDLPQGGILGDIALILIIVLLIILIMKMTGSEINIG